MFNSIFSQRNQISGANGYVELNNSQLSRIFSKSVIWLRRRKQKQNG